MRRHIFTALVLAGALASPAHAPAADTTPVGVTLESVRAQGAGCGAEDVVVDISPDGQALTVLFSKLGVEVVPGAPAQARTECRLDLRFNVPKHWSYALENVDFRGFVFLEPGVTAEQTTRFHIQGEAPETGVSASFVGETEESDYLLQARAVDGPLAWSRCGKGKFVKLSTTVAVSNARAPSGTGMLQVTSADAQVYHLRWRRCER